MASDRKSEKEPPKQATRGYQSGNVKPSQAKPPMANGVSFEWRGSRKSPERRRK